MIVTNFGRNVRFEPGRVVTPRDEDDVLAALERYRSEKVRTVGSLHSWSEAPVCPGVMLVLSDLDDVALKKEPNGVAYAEIGAGCTVDRALDYLHTRGYTLPTYGIVGKQTIAGAI